MFPSSTKREIRHFHVVVVQRRQRNVQKSVTHVQSCYFANLNLLVYSGRSRRRSRRLCVSSLLIKLDTVYCIFCCYVPAICIWREKTLYHGQDLRNVFFHQKQTWIWSGIKGISDLKWNNNLCDILPQTNFAYTRVEWNLRVSGRPSWLRKLLTHSLYIHIQNGREKNLEHCGKTLPNNCYLGLSPW